MNRRVLSWLTVLVGLVLAATPWLLRFAGDRVALVDVRIGGLIVVLLGALALTGAPSAHAVAGRHPSH